MAYAEKRLVEISKLIEEGRFAEIRIAVLSFESEINGAILELETLSELDPARAASLALEITSALSRYAQNLSALAASSPESVKGEVSRALDTTMIASGLEMPTFDDNSNSNGNVNEAMADNSNDNSNVNSNESMDDNSNSNANINDDNSNDNANDDNSNSSINGNENDDVDDNSNSNINSNTNGDDDDDDDNSNSSSSSNTNDDSNNDDDDHDDDDSDDDDSDDDDDDDD